MKSNESTLDRVVRVILGLAIIVLAYLKFQGLVQIILYVVAVILLFTAATGFCGLYKVLGINTKKEAKEDNSEEQKEKVINGKGE